MKKAGYLLAAKWLICLIVLVCLIGSVIFMVLRSIPEKAKTSEKPEIEMRGDIKVVIDPGHGGIDSGTHDGDGFLEKDITLDIGLKMREYLLTQGVPVIMTRETDDDVSDIDGRGRHRRDLERRVKIINQGTLGVSIHVNSTSSPTEKGFIVFYPKDSKEGKALAEKAIKALTPIGHPNHDFPVPKKNIFILRNAQVPVILVEVGFMSNLEDKNKLGDLSYRQKIAEALGQAVIE
ncbi:N-acetylmuramoyl-L-alanine amidase family protein [Desulfitibacter alkalitolerans]|uniref:N-acetylmuramoyl-L-alanine amidase family protein n=1 Tax=Desulfitibacter alkalitolerans TaxID=264641 RepID=UPI0006853326|nr:N-acetylmuramoyl-L-alanine amidase [Desulfitibacter alkalitolerans]